MPHACGDPSRGRKRAAEGRPASSDAGGVHQVQRVLVPVLNTAATFVAACVRGERWANSAGLRRALCGTDLRQLAHAAADLLGREAGVAEDEAGAGGTEVVAGEGVGPRCRGGPRGGRLRGRRGRRGRSRWGAGRRGAWGTLKRPRSGDFRVQHEVRRTRRDGHAAGGADHRMRTRFSRRWKSRGCTPGSTASSATGACC